MAEPRDGYSRLQIVLHWTVALLVVLQYVLHDGIEDAWDAFLNGTFAPTPLAGQHAVTGMLIFVLALWRLSLRWTRGVPGLPPGHPPVLALLAHATHWALYALIVVMPIAGAAAWFGGVKPAAGAHAAAASVLFWLVVLHALAALGEHFVLRTDVLRRMLAPRG